MALHLDLHVEGQVAGDAALVEGLIVRRNGKSRDVEVRRVVEARYESFDLNVVVVILVVVSIVIVTQPIVLEVDLSRYQRAG